MRIRLRLRTRIALLVLLGAVLVAAGVALLLANAVSVRNNANSALGDQNYIAQVGNSELLLIDAETGLRGYLLTGKAPFLAPLNEARAELPAVTEALERQAPFDRARAAQLAAAERAYLAGYVRRGLALGSGHLRSSRVDAITLEGKNLVDAIRGKSLALELAIFARLTASQAATRHSASRSIGEAIAVLVLLTGLLIALGSILGRLAITQQRRRVVSEQISLTLQQSMLPPPLPNIPGCECASRFLPVAGLVGGDFLDVFEIAGAGWAIVVGDVCGKGAPAAALTAMARWTLRTSLAAGTPPPQALRLLNDSMLMQEDPDRRFVTIACATFTVDSEGADVLVACAGHPPPILVPRSGPAVAVPASGTLLGVAGDIELDTASLRLHYGEGLIAYTDGLTDQGPGTGVRLEDALAERPREATADQLCAILERYSGEEGASHRDDVAIVALRFVGEDAKGKRLADSSSSTRAALQT